MIKKLDEVCRFYSGTGFPVAYQGKRDGELPFYKVGDIANNVAIGNVYLSLCNNYISRQEASEIRGSIIPKGTVVFAKIGEALKLNRRAITSCDCLIDNNAMGIAPMKELLRTEYFFYFMKQLKMQEHAETTTVPSVRRSKLEQVEIDVPSLDKQEEIEQILNKTSVLIHLRQQQLQKLDDLVKARFIELFGGIHNSKKYPYKPIQELTDVISGGTPNRDVNEYWECGTIPWVKTTELQNNLIKEVDEYITEKGLNSSSAKLVPPGTVLIAMYGQGKTRGMTAYLNIEACTNQACACILPSDQINQTFLWKFLILSYDDLRGMAKGGNQPNLNGTIIKNYPILYPPRELQEQFAAFVEQTDKSKVAVQKALDEAQLLFDSLMQKYFE